MIGSAAVPTAQIEPSTSRKWALLNFMICPGTTVSVAREYLEGLAAKVSPTSIMVIKQQVYRQLMMPLGAAMTETNQAMDDSLKRGDFREGVRSFLEQRPPVFPRLGGG